MKTKKEASLAAKEMLKEMSVNEITDLLAEWGFENLTCLGHAERFCKTVYLKIEKKHSEQPKINKNFTS